MTDPHTVHPSSALVTRWAVRLATMFPSGRALDVAAGHGRHALTLAAAGLHVTAIDRRLEALAAASAAAAARGLRLRCVCADLTQFPLPRNRFDVVVVTRYLDRSLFPALRDALVPGGVLLYETFTEHQLRYNHGPRSRAHLLAPGELRWLLRGMQVLVDEERVGPDALAGIVARKP